MSTPTLSFFNNKGGVGKTTLVYHLSWMLAELGLNVLVVDADPQANLTAAFLDEAALIDLWNTDPGQPAQTLFDALRPLTRVGDILPVQARQITPGLHLIPGDLALSGFEDPLSEQWAKALSEENAERALLVLSAFWRVAQQSAADLQADLIIFDVGPNLGAINRSVLLGTDHVIVPLAADLFSLQGLRNLGPALKRWRSGWAVRRQAVDATLGPLPDGAMQPAGYIGLQHQERLSRPVQAYVSWLNRIPGEYRQCLLYEPAQPPESLPDIRNDPHCLALLRHYKSLIPFAQEARKPVFKLRSADGAIGSHGAAVSRAYQDFEQLACKILDRIGLALPL
ncbi:MAG: AAA family ATPase [Curvibacter sp.]|nr:AAA family ATPase [Curvibacter sp.]